MPCTGPEVLYFSSSQQRCNEWGQWSSERLGNLLGITQIMSKYERQDVHPVLASREFSFLPLCPALSMGSNSSQGIYLLSGQPMCPLPINAPLTVLDGGLQNEHCRIPAFKNLKSLPLLAFQSVIDRGVKTVHLVWTTLFILHAGPCECSICWLLLKNWKAQRSPELSFSGSWRSLDLLVFFLYNKICSDISKLTINLKTKPKTYLHILTENKGFYN